MPFYEYECTACGEITEELQKFSDPVLEICPHCGKSTLKKLISKSAFALKGTGWYVTDFKDPKPSTTTEKPSESSNKSSDNSVSSAEKTSKTDSNGSTIQNKKVDTTKPSSS